MFFWAYPTPGIMSRTRAVDVSIQAISPACKILCQSCRTGVAREAYIVMDVQIFQQGVAARWYGAIVGYLDCIVEFVEVHAVHRRQYWSAIHPGCDTVSEVAVVTAMSRRVCGAT